MITGALRQYVTLANRVETLPNTGDLYESLTPPAVFMAIEPLSPQNTDRMLTHLAVMRYHPQVSVDTVITYGTRQLFVRGVQNVEERNVELRLLCEEVIP